MEVKPLTIELEVGYTDKQGQKHTRVTFAKRITGKDLFRIDDDPQSQNAAQYQALILRAAITEFGTLKMPVPLDALLSLDSIDGDDLNETYEKFQQADFRSELVAENEIKLPIGYESNGLVYDVAQFGVRLTGWAEVEAARQQLAGTRRACFFVGRQIAQLSQSSSGSSVLAGPIGLNVFEQLDVLDIFALRAAAEVWRQSFRRAGARVQANGRSAKRAADSGADGLERVGDSEPIS